MSTPLAAITMTVEQAQAIVERARSKGEYVDLEEGDDSVTLDGRYKVEVLEALIVLMRTGTAMPMRWSGE